MQNSTLSRWPKLTGNAIIISSKERKELPMKNLKKLNENETHNINGGGNHCKICGYGNNTYKS